MTFATVWSSLWDAKWLIGTLVFAILLFIRTRWSAAVRTAVADLLDALRGVLPPVAVVAIVGAFTTPLPLVQVAIGAAIGTILAHWGVRGRVRPQGPAAQVRADRRVDRRSDLRRRADQAHVPP